MSTPKSFMGRCCTDRFYLDKCDCEKDKTMRVGDRVVVNDKCELSKSFRSAVKGQIGVVIQSNVLDELVISFHPGFFGVTDWILKSHELDVIECINNEEICFDENCKRCMSIAYDPTTGD